jgi:cytoskeleton protein RodZ
MSENRREALAPEGAGAQLLALRVQMGLSIHDISLQLRFGERQISALEAGNYDALPDITVARALVRSYARLLGADVAPILQALESERPDSIVAPLQTHNVAVPSQGITFSINAQHLNRRWVLASAVLLTLTVAAGLWWFVEGKAHNDAAAPTAEVPAASETVPANIPMPPPNMPAPLAQPNVNIPLAQPASKPGMSY